MNRSAQEILDAFKGAKNLPYAALNDYYDQLCIEAYALPTGGQKILLDKLSPIGERISIAQQACYQALSSSSVDFQLPQFNKGKKEKEVTQIETSQNLQSIIENPEAYGLKEEDLNDYYDAAFYINSGHDSLNPENINNDELKDEIRRQKEADRAALQAKKEHEAYEEISRGTKDQDTLSARYGKARKKIRNEIYGTSITVTEEEVRSAYLERRKQETLKFLNEQQETLSKNKNQPTTNSKRELLALEKNIQLLVTAREKLSNEQKKELTGQISSGIGTAANIIKSGQGGSLFKSAAQYAASKLAKKYAIAAVGKWAAMKTFLATIGTGAGGPLGTIIGLFADKLIRGGLKFAKNMAMLTASSFVAGMLSLIGLIIPTLGAIGSSVGIALGGTVIGLPVLLALFLFIINSGGYITPPSKPVSDTGDVQDGTDTATFGGGGETDYIRVVKTPSPPGPFATAGTSVSYVIEIQAKAVPLTNVRLSYDCYVSFVNLPCPSVTPAIPSAPTGNTIKPGEPFIIRYTSNYPTSYNNSVVVDSLTVTADIPERSITNHRASGFAAVRFGEPSTKCLKFDETWLPASKNVMYVAIAQLMRETRFINLLCSGPTIQLSRQLRDPGYGGITNQFDITFFNQAFNNGVKSAFYTLAHEIGHAFAHVNPNIFIRYVATVPLPANGGYICTYPTGARTGTRENKLNENYAEATALFFLSRSASSSTVDLSCLGGKPFISAYPDYYAFLKNYMF